MYLSYILYTNIQINTILKSVFQNGGNIVFYRNFLERINNNTYRKKNNIYIIFTNLITLDILQKIFKNKINICKYDITKLKYLNIMNSINFKIYKYENKKNDEILLNDKNNINFNIFKEYIEKIIIETLRKICTKYIPVKILLTPCENNINLNIIFDDDIKIKYKYIIFLILKNKLLTFYMKNDYVENESYSLVFI